MFHRREAQFCPRHKREHLLFIGKISLAFTFKKMICDLVFSDLTRAETIIKIIRIIRSLKRFDKNDLRRSFV